MKRLSALFLLALAALASASACTSSAKPVAPASQPTPTPSIGRTDPDVVEETPTYYVKRYRKADYIRLDERHLRHPNIPFPVEFFREDDEYFYVWNAKPIPEEAERLKQQWERQTGTQDPTLPRDDKPKPPPEDYASLTPQRVSARLRLEEVANSGLPANGLWRASFAIADMNGDGIPDVVAPPSRLSGDTKLHIWLGDGKGHFAPWQLTFVENGKENPNFALDYGGVAIGDVDGDGQLDVVAASHSRGLVALFGNGKGTFVVSRAGFRGQDFSTQAVALADVDGDGKLDVVAAADRIEVGTEPWRRDQVQVYLYRGNRTFERKLDALQDGAYSNSAASLDFDRDGRTDVLFGSHYFAAVLLVFHNEGNGRFSQVVVPDLEVWSYHFSVTPGTFGKERAAAFADLFMKGSYADLQADGINVHTYRKGRWEKHVVWRERGYRAVLRTVAFGDLDGDGLDDVVFPDTKSGRLRIFFQRPDGSFDEANEQDEPKIAPIAQCVRLADLDGDGRLDVVLAKTVESSEAVQMTGGWTVFLNRAK